MHVRRGLRALVVAHGPEGRRGSEPRGWHRRRFSHHFSHHLCVTGWTCRLRLGLCFQLLASARYGLLRPFLFSQAECRRFDPGIPLKKN
jgi:hypothetical protein